jgi:hypothetical protein
MKPHACFRISLDELAKDLGTYVELAKTPTFEIYADGAVEVILVRIAAIPEWNRRLQRSVRCDLLAAEEWEAFTSPNTDWSHLPDNYDDRPDEGG